jgi:hypothetical protein
VKTLQKHNITQQFEDLRHDFDFCCLLLHCLVKEILDTAETNPSMEIAATTDLYVWIVWPMRHRQPEDVPLVFFLSSCLLFVSLLSRSLPDADGDEMTAFRMTEPLHGQKMYVELLG